MGASASGRAGRGTKEFSEGEAMFLIMFVWWLIRYIQLSEVIRLNTCDLCILLCADYGSVIKRRLG